jgi:hypothetical protein
MFGIREHVESDEFMGPPTFVLSLPRSESLWSHAVMCAFLRIPVVQCEDFGRRLAREFAVGK